MIAWFIILPVSIARAQLSGQYTVGNSAGSDYATLTEVVASLQSNSVVGDLNFVLESGTYEDVLAFTSLNNGGYSISIQGEDAINTVLKPNNVAVGGTAGISLLGVDHITFENLTVDMSNISSSTYSMNSNRTQGIYVEDVTDLLFDEVHFSNANSTGVNPDYISSSIYLYTVENVVVNNCTFSGAANHIRFREYSDITITNCDFSTSQRPINGSVNGSVTGDGLLVSSNTMSNVVQGMFMNAGRDINSGITNITIENNVITSVDNALDLRGLHDFEIRNNTITTSEDDGIGIEVSYTGVGLIENNIIDAYQGIYSFTNSDDASVTTVANNMVKGVEYAVRFSANNNSQLYHNTLYSSAEGDISDNGDGTYRINDPWSVILLQGFLDTVYVVNNIISGKYLGDGFYNSGIEIDYPTFDTLYINYNLYDTALTSIIGEDLGRLEIEDIDEEILTLSEWQKDDRELDINSRAPDYDGSLFVSEDDLHITDVVDFRFGKYMADLSTDIDGHIRLETIGVDVGADQYVGEVFDSFSCLDIYDNTNFGTNINGAEFCFVNSCSESLEADTIILDYETNANDFSITNLEFEVSDNDIDVTFDLYYQGAYLTVYNHLFEIVQDDVEEDSTYSSNLRIMYDDDSETTLDHCFSLNFDFSLAPGGSCGVAFSAAVGSNTTDYSKGDQWYTYTNNTSDLQYVQVTSYGYTTEATDLHLYTDCDDTRADYGNEYDGGDAQSDRTAAVYPGETLYIHWEDDHNSSNEFNWHLGYQDIQTYGALECDTTVQIFEGSNTYPYLSADGQRKFYYVNESSVLELLTVSSTTESRIALRDGCDGNFYKRTQFEENPVTGMFIEPEDTVFIQVEGGADIYEPYDLEIDISSSDFDGITCSGATEVEEFGDYIANMRPGHGTAWFSYVNNTDTTQAIQVTSCLGQSSGLSLIVPTLYHSCDESSSGSSIRTIADTEFCDKNGNSASRAINYVKSGETIYINWFDDTGSSIDEDFNWSLNPYYGYIGGLSCEDPVRVDEGTHLANDEFDEQWYLFTNESADSLYTVKISSCGTIADATNIIVYDSCGGDALAQSDGDNASCSDNPYSSEIIEEVYPRDALYMVWLNTGDYIVYDWTLEIQSKAFVCVDTDESISLEIEVCDEYEFDGELLSESGRYFASLQSQQGCDSLVTLDLTILEPTSSSTDVSACESYDWNGTTFTTSGTYQELLTNAAGCDSTATLVLTILEPSAGSDDVSACSSYLWEGEELTTSGVYEKTLVNAAGCDSIATLDLTILEPTSSLDEVTHCDSYEWGGVIYVESGSYEQLLTNAAGCDSTAVLDLTILVSTTGEEAVEACTSYEWQGITYDASGVYETMLLNQSGCDSTATLDLTILPEPNAQLEVVDDRLTLSEINAGDSYQWYDCATDLPIAGATGPAFESSEDGEYYIEVSNGLCTVISLCTEAIMVVTSAEEVRSPEIKLYPNPAKNYLNIELGEYYEEVQLEIIDMSGKQLQSSSAFSTDRLQVDLGQWTGILVVRISASEGVILQSRVLVR